MVSSGKHVTVSMRASYLVWQIQSGRNNGPRVAWVGQAHLPKVDKCSTTQSIYLEIFDEANLARGCASGSVSSSMAPAVPSSDLGSLTTHLKIDSVILTDECPGTHLGHCTDPYGYPYPRHGAGNGLQRWQHAALP